MQLGQLLAKCRFGGIPLTCRRRVVSEGWEGNRNQRTAQQEGSDSRFHPYDLIRQDAVFRNPAFPGKPDWLDAIPARGDCQIAGRGSNPRVALSSIQTYVSWVPARSA